MNPTDASSPPLARVEALLGRVLGRPGEDGWTQRREQARASADEVAQGFAPDQLVYGELDLPALVRLLDAAGLNHDEAFLDIGSGDGGPVLAAALLYPAQLRVCRGVELLPGLWSRSQHHLAALRALLAPDEPIAPVELLPGDVYRCEEPDAAALRHVLADTSLALCFATTWSQGAPNRELPQLSQVLGRHMAPGSRAILVDARLLPEADGWTWEGDLRITLRDTAPYSTARLYMKRG